MSSVTGYLGPEGSYSHIAAKKLAEGEIAPFQSFFLLVKALKEGAVDAIVLPVENSLNGGVTQNLDLLQETDGICAVAETLVKIEHRLVTLKGADLSKITTIYSHQQALGQCAKYLCSHFPKAALRQTSSTSGCLEMIKSPSDAGIVGCHCVAEGLEMSKECISDEPLNFTQFLLVKRGSAEDCKKSAKIYFSVTCLHRPGALVSALSVLARRGINMTKIESRPIKDKVGEYRFFIETEADCGAENTRAAMKELRENCSSVKILGCY